MDATTRSLYLAEVGVLDRFLDGDTDRNHGHHTDVGHDGMGHEYPEQDSQLVAMECHEIDAATIQAISDDLIARLFAVIDSSFIFKNMAGFAFKKLDGHFQNSGIKQQEGLVGITLQEVYLNISALLHGHVSSRYSEGYTYLTEPDRSQVDETVLACIKALKIALTAPFVSGTIKQPVMDFSELLATKHIPGTGPAVAEILGNVWVAIKEKMEAEARRSAPRTRAS